MRVLLFILPVLDKAERGRPRRHHQQEGGADAVERSYAVKEKGRGCLSTGRKKGSHHSSGWSPRWGELLVLLRRRRENLPRCFGDNLDLEKKGGDDRQTDVERGVFLAYSILDGTYQGTRTPPEGKERGLRFFQKERNAVVTLPTGTGKSLRKTGSSRKSPEGRGSGGAVPGCVVGIPKTVLEGKC